jgi:flagellar biosynthesis/type III secretory pathway chaperone
MDASRLINILAEQSKIYTFLIDLSKQMQEAIKVNNIQKIDSLIKVQMALVMKLSSFEKKRVRVAKEISSEINVDPDDLTITEVKTFLEEKQYKSLESLEQELDNNITTLAEINNTNKLLINNGLDLIEFSLNLLGASESVVYDNQGDVRKKQLIDEKV